MQLLPKIQNWLSPANCLFLSLFLSLFVFVFFPPNYIELQMAMWLRLVVDAVLLNKQKTAKEQYLITLNTTSIHLNNPPPPPPTYSRIINSTTEHTPTQLAT
ncbi:unnamed protein product [Ceratitis capitata]|uniref:(Mediterranean fruit fly) hypothetical protein n=1 Tax=Ceratitis capitata TaxID=7213 RepID=A0A811U1E1_CERCA|nr:unnamed protein product [Ceratitis capitata]